MSAHLLAIDIGNSQTTIGLFDGSKLIEQWRISTRVVRTADEVWLLYSQLLNTCGYATESIKQVAIASVVPEQTDAYVKASANRLKHEPLVISHRNVKILRVDYEPPSSVGADRLCGAVAAFKLYDGPVIVVDLGTATVFDVVTADAVYTGGLIAPGVSTAIDSLHHSTALLPRVDLEFPEQVIGRTTESAIRSGILLGAVAMIDGIVARIRQQLGIDAPVVATGGFSGLLEKHSTAIQYVEPDLVLHGIRIIAESQ
ncbi:MAG: type III pantothenate kinase [Calditrichota bacterium]